MILHGASAQNALIYKKVSTIAQNIMQIFLFRAKIEAQRGIAESKSASAAAHDAGFDH